MTEPHVAVVGGGVSGLAAAYRLRKLLGPLAAITVVEQTDRVGGKLRTVELAGRCYDVGAEAFLARRGEATELITEIGMADELVHPTSAGATIRAGGRITRLPGHTLQGVPASVEAVRGVLSEQALRRVAEEPSLPPIHLDGEDVSVGGLLRERFGPEVTNRLVDPLLGGVYAGHADGLSLRATMAPLAGALDRGAGSLVAAAAALVPAPPRPGVARPPVFGTLRAGLGSLTDRLAKVADATIEFGRPVRRLRRREAGWTVEFGDHALDVDGVVLAVPAPAAAKLLAEVAPVAAAAFGGIELASMAVVALALPADVALPQNSGVLIAGDDRWADGTRFTAKAFTYSSRKWAHLDGEETLVIRGSVGKAGEVAALQVDDEDLIRAVRADLAELTGITAAPVDASVTRWGGGLPQYGVGHLDRVAAIETAVAELPGLAVAGASLHGVGVPACIATSQAAAARVAAHLLGRHRGTGGTMGAWPA
jgi:oxygen-dependent protoporphyrinogen oxidase